MNSLVAVERLRIGSKSKLKLVPMVKPPRVGSGARRLNFFDPEVSIGNCFHVGVHINKKLLREKKENNFRSAEKVLLPRFTRENSQFNAISERRASGV